MPLTVTFDTPRSRGIKFSGSGKQRRGTANLGVYTGPGGVVATPDKFLLDVLDHIDISPAVDGTTLFVWDKANGKIKAFSAVGTEVTNSTDITTKVFRFSAEGT